MNSHRSIKFAVVAMAAAGLLFAGCAKKEVVSEPAAKPTTAPVQKTVSKPSTISVYFAFDKSNLDSASQAVLDAWATWLNSNSTHVTVEGNCDQRGSREYNLALGQRRADSVRDYLVSHGVSASRIDTVSFGEEKPVCTGSGEACWAQNRRADIR
ncbi:MAG TPA: peptidoglycan-associated lipoprotein Pal [Mariprofundaceae bacterium]|nr:peptidoglycan-associated lipoprotein Pal [Mariprofundaceae bacterium]